MPRKPRKPKQIEPAATPEVIETEREIAAVEPMTPDQIRHIPDEPVDAKDVFDEVLQAKAQHVQEQQPEAPQQHSREHSQRRFEGRSTLGFYTPDRGAVRVVDEGRSVGIQMDEKPSAEELKVLREPRGEERGLAWNSVRGMNFKPTNGHPIRARLDTEQRAEEIARGKGWRSALDEQRSEPEERSR